MIETVYGLALGEAVSRMSESRMVGHSTCFSFRAHIT